MELEYKENIINTIDEHTKQINQLCKNMKHTINYTILENIIDLLIKSKNKHIYWCGVGKSGNICKQISDIFKSINYQSSYLCPLSCLHGDIGILREGDMVFLISKSGNTQELINLIPLFKEKNVKIIGMINNKDSKLSKYCHYLLQLPPVTELDNNFNLLPTTSVISQLMMGNIIGSLLIKYNNFDTQQYSINHNSGEIGKLLLVTAKDIMLDLSQISISNKEDNLMVCIMDICAKKTGASIIIDNKTIIGILTDGDIRRNIQNIDTTKCKVKDFMVKNPKCVLETDNLYTIKLILNNSVSCLPVINIKQELVGLIIKDNIINI